MVKVKRFIMFMLALAVIFIPVSAGADENRNVVVFVEGKLVDFPDQKPYISTDRTYVPIRFVSEALGAKVDWDSGTVYIKDSQHDVSLTVGSYTYYVNSIAKTLDAPPEIIGGRTMVPLRFVSEALGRKADYIRQGTYGRVDIYSKNKPAISKPVEALLMDQALGGDYMKPYDPNGDIIGQKDEWLCKIDNVVYVYGPSSIGIYGEKSSDYVSIHFDEQKAGPGSKILIRNVVQRFMPDKVNEVMEQVDVAIAQFHKITANKPDIPSIPSETGARWFVKAHADTTGDFVSAQIPLSYVWQEGVR